MPKRRPTEAELLARFWERVEKTDGCWLWVADPKRRYGSMLVNGQQIGAHVYSYRIHCGPEGDQFVCHTCDNKRCVRPDHLFLGTAQDNQIDCSRKRRRHGMKLTPDEIRALRYLLSLGEWSQAILASWFGIRPCHVSNIAAGRIWAHI